MVTNAVPSSKPNRSQSRNVPAMTRQKPSTTRTRSGRSSSEDNVTRKSFIHNKRNANAPIRNNIERQQIEEELKEVSKKLNAYGIRIKNNSEPDEVVEFIRAHACSDHIGIPELSSVRAVPYTDQLVANKPSTKRSPTEGRRKRDTFIPASVTIACSLMHLVNTIKKEKRGATEREDLEDKAGLYIHVSPFTALQLFCMVTQEPPYNFKLALPSTLPTLTFTQENSKKTNNGNKKRTVRAQQVSHFALRKRLFLTRAYAFYVPGSNTTWFSTLNDEVNNGTTFGGANTWKARVKTSAESIDIKPLDNIKLNGQTNDVIDFLNNKSAAGRYVASKEHSKEGVLQMITLKCTPKELLAAVIEANNTKTIFTDSFTGLQLYIAIAMPPPKGSPFTLQLKPCGADILNQLYRFTGSSVCIRHKSISPGATEQRQRNTQYALRYKYRVKYPDEVKTETRYISLTAEGYEVQEAKEWNMSSAMEATVRNTGKTMESSIADDKIDLQFMCSAVYDIFSKKYNSTLDDTPTQGITDNKSVQTTSPFTEVTNNCLQMLIHYVKNNPIETQEEKIEENLHNLYQDLRVQAVAIWHEVFRQDKKICFSTFAAYFGEELSKRQNTLLVKAMRIWHGAWQANQINNKNICLSRFVASFYLASQIVYDDSTPLSHFVRKAFDRFWPYHNVIWPTREMYDAAVNPSISSDLRAISFKHFKEAVGVCYIEAFKPFSKIPRSINPIALTTRILVRGSNSATSTVRHSPSGKSGSPMGSSAASPYSPGSIKGFKMGASTSKDPLSPLVSQASDDDGSPQSEDSVTTVTPRKKEGQLNRIKKGPLNRIKKEPLKKISHKFNF